MKFLLSILCLLFCNNFILSQDFDEIIFERSLIVVDLIEVNEINSIIICENLISTEKKIYNLINFEITDSIIIENTAGLLSDIVNSYRISDGTYVSILSDGKLINFDMESLNYDIIPLREDIGGDSLLSINESLHIDSTIVMYGGYSVMTNSGSRFWPYMFTYNLITRTFEQFSSQSSLGVVQKMIIYDESILFLLALPQDGFSSIVIYDDQFNENFRVQLEGYYTNLEIIEDEIYLAGSQNEKARIIKYNFDSDEITSIYESNNYHVMDIIKLQAKNNLVFTETIAQNMPFQFHMQIVSLDISNSDYNPEFFLHDSDAFSFGTNNLVIHEQGDEILLGGYTMAEDVLDDFTGFLIRMNTSLVNLDNVIRSNQEVGVYPNPVVDNISVNKEGVVEFISIINQNGMIINQCQGCDNISTSSLPKGPYFIQIQINGKVEVLKFIKK